MRKLVRESWRLLASLRWLKWQYVHDQVSYTTRGITLGHHTYGRPRIAMDGSQRSAAGRGSRVRIGAYCSIAQGVIFLEGGNHPTDWVSTFPLRIRLGLPGAYEDGHPFDKGDVVVGNDVWIGRDARIFSGVTIGDGAVIGGCSIVTRDVEPYTIVAGIPARPIRRRFSDEQIEALLRIRWWDWPEEKVRENVDLINGRDVDGFIRRHSGQSGPAAD